MEAQIEHRAPDYRPVAQGGDLHVHVWTTGRRNDTVSHQANFITAVGDRHVVQAMTENYQSVRFAYCVSACKDAK